MSELLGITVEDLVATATQRKARIPSEIGAFVALEVCETLSDGPARVRPKDVRIADDGTISVFALPHSATEEEAARSVVALLGALLVAAGTGVPRGLVALLERGPTSGRWDLASLRDDLEASLVPLNRAAARRVLSRMLRDVRRPPSSQRPPSTLPEPPPSDASLDAQLDELLEGSAAPAAASPPPAAIAAALDAELDATISELDAVRLEQSATNGAGRDAPKRPATTPSTSGARAFARASDAPVEPDDATMYDDAGPSPIPSAARTPGEGAPSRGSTANESTLDLDTLGAELERAPKRGGALGWLLAFVALIAVTTAALAVMRPDLVDRALGRAPSTAPDPGPSAADHERMLREHRGRFGTLTVTVSPPRAQVLMYVGRGPALATDLPVGVAHEFVAIADGRAPTRAVVPPDATWESVDGRPRYELAMQTGAEPMEELALGATMLPRDIGTPTGALGDVRVITNPPGAKVYVVVGFAPDVTIENVRTDEAVELIAYIDGSPIERVVIGPSDWEEDPDGSKRASASISLEPEAPRRR